MAQCEAGAVEQRGGATDVPVVSLAAGRYGPSRPAMTGKLHRRSRGAVWRSNGSHVAPPLEIVALPDAKQSINMVGQWRDQVPV